MQGLHSDTAIDLGSETVRMRSHASKDVVAERAMLAIRNRGARTGEIVAFGSAAAEMSGREAESVTLARPVREGAIADLETAIELIDRMAPRHWPSRSVFRPRAAFAVSHTLTDIEHRVFSECAFKIGARENYLVPKLVAAGIGAELPIDEASTTCVLDLGAETTEIGVLSPYGIAASASLPTSGRRLDRAIADYLRKKCDLVVSERAAQQLKHVLGAANPMELSEHVEVRGRHAVSGLPARGLIAAEEIREGIEPEIEHLAHEVRRFLGELSPELSSDLCDRGIVLTGGGSLLVDLDVRLRDETGLIVVRADSPTDTVVRGLSLLLAQPKAYEHLVF